MRHDGHHQAYIGSDIHVCHNGSYNLFSYCDGVRAAIKCPKLNNKKSGETVRVKK